MVKLRVIEHRQGADAVRRHIAFLPDRCKLMRFVAAAAGIGAA